MSESRKLALLIGVSDYRDGLEPLSAPPKDVAAIKRVLENPDLGGFDPAHITTLINPDLAEMREKIEDVFTRSSKQDLVVLYFSGHGITDDNNRLYLTTKHTSKDRYRSRSVPASFIQDLSDVTYAKRQVIILDCCYSGAFAEGWRRKGNVKVELERELGKEGRVVLTSSSATQVSFQQEDADLSLYTQYLVEGIETGAADADRDGQVKVRELHAYAKRKVQEAKPKMKPDIIVADDEGYEILVSRVKLDAALQFRQSVEECVDHELGDILDIDLETLQVRAQRLGVMPQQAQEIINSVLEPFRRRQRNLQRYRDKYTEYANHHYPLSPRRIERLQVWQEEVLGLEDHDVAPIQQEINRQHEQRLAETQQNTEAILAEPPPQKMSAPQPAPDRGAHPQNLAPTQTRRLAETPEPIIQSSSPQTFSNPSPPQAVSSSGPQSVPEPGALTPNSRRQLLKWAGWGGGGLMLAIITGQLFKGSISDSPSEPDRASESTLTPVQFQTVQVNATGEVIEETSGEAHVYDEDLGNDIALRMVEVQGGEFWMGQTEAEKEEIIRQRGEEKYQEFYARELPRHQVRVPSFFMGMFAVTQAQYEAVMGNNPATEYDEKFVAPDKPVVGVSWEDAIAYCEKLSELTGREYRLPSESEWEYACRAGTETPFYFGETITTDLANYRGIESEWGFGNYGEGPKGIFREETTPVGSFSANAFGLFDMHGNVWEWCQDVFHSSYEGAPTDGRAWTVDGEEDYRIFRGGCWFYPPLGCRSALRTRSSPGLRDSDLGFRVVSVSAQDS